MASPVLFVFAFCVGSFSSTIARPAWKGSGYFITRPEINLCTLRVNKEDITSYKEFVVGRGWIVRPCAPGTSYDPKTCTCSNIFPKEQKDAISDTLSENDRKASNIVTETGARSEDDTETGISYGTVYGSYKHSSKDDYRPVNKDELDTSNSMESNKDAYNTRGYSKNVPDARDYSKNGPDAREYSEDAYDTRGYSENAYDMRNKSLNKSTNHNTDKHKRLENKIENNLMNKLLKLVFQNTSKDEIDEVGAIIEELLLKHLDSEDAKI